ncbi:DUF3616 domain-containing protein [Azospirillum sp. B21]|nr:DUF3616 domain-containing protein [Azospirillum sp. B21]
MLSRRVKRADPFRRVARCTTMIHTAATPNARLRLTFHPHDAVDPALEKPVRNNISVAVAIGRCLFVASDEGARIERLIAGPDGHYADHRSFALTDFFDLPAGPEGEADVEGLAVDDGWLWVVGSHSLARRKPKPQEHSGDECLKRLTEVKREANRCLLGRIPLAAIGDGVFDPVRRHEGRLAACVKMGRKRNALAKALKGDEHIGRFVHIPAKENGLDIEGIAVRGNRVFLGLRGPVLRGWACILDLRIAGSGSGRLKLRTPDGKAPAYRKRFIDLDGLGIRELTFDGDDLLILAGPTMDLDGPAHVWRWSGCLDADSSTIVPRDRLTRVLDVPFGTGFDHAEGIAWLPGGTGDPERRLIVVYDNPGDDRLHPNGTGVDADIFAIAADASHRRTVSERNDGLRGEGCVREIGTAGSIDAQGGRTE